MHWTFLDLLPIALFAVCLIGLKPMRPFSAFNPNYLSSETGLAFRGIFALLVILHHLALKIPQAICFRPLVYFGYPAVSVFFFLSGYGLMKSYVTRESYRKRFLRRRLPKIVVPYVILTVVFWGFHAANGNIISFKSLVLSTIYGYPIVSYSWYILCILAFYVAFWVLMFLFKRRFSVILLGSCVWCAIYIAFCFYMNYGKWWYRTVPLLIVGMIWALCEGKVLHVLHRFYVILAPITWLLFGGMFYFFVKHTDKLSSQLFASVFVLCLCTLFIFSILFVTLKSQIGNPVLLFLGKNGLEIYLVQGLFIQGLRSNLLNIQNDFLWALLCVIGSVALGAALHALTSVITRKIR